jgi:ketosteroid isomerase-like protein
MSSANLELVRRIYAAVGRGDYGSASWADPEIEYVVIDGPEPGTRTGLAGIADVLRTMFDAFEDLRDEPEDYRELDETRVLVLSRLSGRGKASGTAVRQKAAQVFELRDGKVIRIIVYMDRDRALADLGLEHLEPNDDQRRRV